MNRWLLLSVLLTVAAFGSVAYLYFAEYDRLPERVPVHWNASGTPDGFTSRQHAFYYLLIAPGSMLFMVVLTLVLPWLSPKQYELDRNSPTYGYVMFIVVALSGYLHVVITRATFQGDRQTDIGGWMMGGILIFMVLIGNVLGRVPRNFFIGVRTPWTLASETVWVRTHRVAAWLFVGLGLAGLAAILVGMPPLWCVPVILVMAFTPVVYSLVIYKRLQRQGKL